MGVDSGNGFGLLVLLLFCFLLGYWVGHGDGYNQGVEKGKEAVLETQRKKAKLAAQRRKVLRLLQRHKAELRQNKFSVPGVDTKSVLEVIEAAEKAITAKPYFDYEDYEAYSSIVGEEVASMFVLDSAFRSYYYYRPDEALREYAEYCRANGLPTKWVRECEKCLARLEKAQGEASADGE